MFASSYSLHTNRHQPLVSGPTTQLSRHRRAAECILTSGSRAGHSYSGMIVADRGCTRYAKRDEAYHSLLPECERGETFMAVRRVGAKSTTADQVGLWTKTTTCCVHSHSLRLKPLQANRTCINALTKTVMTMLRQFLHATNVGGSHLYARTKQHAARQCPPCLGVVPQTRSYNLIRPALPPELSLAS